MIGAWLAGLNDNDKLVANAASAAFKQTFTSDEKQRNAWKVFQTPILAYCRDVLFHETIASLSDERTTSPDDAEAKYARVLGSALLAIGSTIGNLLAYLRQIELVLTSAVESLSPDDTLKQNQIYQEILGQERLWKLAIYEESFVRKSLYRLIVAILQKDFTGLLDMKVISKYVVVAALRSDQRGSAYEYSKMLARLSASHPETWRIHTESTKKSPDKSLCQFLTKGSQGAPADFWKQILTVIRHIPLEIHSLLLSESKLQDKGEISVQVLDAIHEGILRKEDSSLSQAEAWTTYLETVPILLQSNTSPAARLQLLESMVVPIIEQYLRPDEKQRRWTVSGSSPAQVVIKALDITLAGSPDAFREAWTRLSDLFVQDIQTSLPEQSQSYTKSQDDLGTKAAKWYNLQAVALKTNDSNTLLTTFVSAIKREIRIAFDVLMARNGKPYGAANSIAIAVRSVPQATLQASEVREYIALFLQRHLASLALSPSLRYLITVTDETRVVGCKVQEACKDAVNMIVSSNISNVRNRGLKTLLASSWLGEESCSVVLGEVVEKELAQSLEGDEEDWDLIAVAMTNPVIPVTLAEKVISTLTASLSVDEKLTAGLRGLNIATQKNMVAVRGFSKASSGPVLLSRLLLLSDSPSEDVSNRAKTLYKAIEEGLSEAVGTEAQFAPMIQVIRDALFGSGIDSVRYEISVSP